MSRTQPAIGTPVTRPSGAEAPTLQPSAQGTGGRWVAAFADDVRRGFSSRPFRLPPHYLYDDLGSSLFEAICHLPWYPITRAEKNLLHRNAATILQSAGRPLTIVELGCGTGEKLDLLLDAWDEEHGELAVALIDVSAAALRQSARLIASRGSARVTCHQALYEVGLAQTAGDGTRRRLVLFLGSNIGNFDPAEAECFLREVARSLGPRDALLMGVDLVKPESVLRLAYDDPLGVTAAFNLNVLSRMNHELDADFDLRAFQHQALWNPEHQRVEMHLVSRCGQVVNVPAARLAVAFEAGDTIWTESSYKYSLSGIEEMLRRANLTATQRWIDLDAGFALVLGARSEK